MKLNNQAKKDLRKLGWHYSNKKSMNNYFVFTRQDEELAIYTDKMKVKHDNYDEDSLNTITYETLKIVIKIMEGYYER